ncbi:MAG TPA: hypothetical protein PLJ62_06370 [Thermoflexales bacterium]|nr:hypothetical protein [Thermoflexales bacterium]HQW34940.1 hypothetical protein [Thermoflexales bacterium]HQZ21728.1 hypothetical protein [Thermoflexales bacterium]HQZ99800.1 hypothetical protein [Thermoflexales bacterium]
MFCVDPYINLLKSNGYNVVRLPRADFAPLLLLAKEDGKDLNRMGHIKDLLIGAAPPRVKLNTPAASISGQRTATINTGIGLTLLGTFISALGGGQVGLDAQFKNTSSIAFEFPEVFADDVDVTKLDQYLGKAQINPNSKQMALLLDLDALYVVTGIIKAKKFSVDTTSASTGSAGLNAPVIQQIVGAKIQVSKDANSASKLSFEGQQMLTFGFQARRLVYDGGDYIQLAAVAPGSVGAKGGILKSQRKKEIEAPSELTKGAFVRLD